MSDGWAIVLGIVLGAVVLIAFVACGEQGLVTPNPAVSDVETVAPPVTSSPVVSDAEAVVPPATPMVHAVAQPDADPEIHIYPNTTWYVAPSLEEQIYDALTYDSFVVVRASLLSATAGAEEIPGGDGAAASYRPTHELRFNVHEYLEGSGPNELLVVVRGDETYPTEASALREANSTLSGRNTSWDNRQAVLFVGLADTTTEAAGDSGVSGTSSARRAAFSRSNPLESPWDYTVDNLSRAWLPAQDVVGGATGQSASDDPSFITDGAHSPPPTIGLADLKAKIAAMKAELSAREGIAGFRECIRGRILDERINRAEPGGPLPGQKTIASGLAAGTEVFKYDEPFRGDPEYSRVWLEGPDSGQFEAVTIDDDENPSNGYNLGFSTARPLPAGEYSVHDFLQHYTDIPCNFKPNNTYLDWTVTVTAPAGTIYEAFFDLLVGAAGVPLPSEFTIGGTSTAVQWLEWRNGTVTLLLLPYADLAGHALDFIALDGTLALSLEANSATADSAAGTLTWAVANQPWREDDQIMLRIRKGSTPGPTATSTPKPTPTPIPTLTPTPTPAPETSEVVDRYDTNDDGVIDRNEYRQALRDYHSGKITYAELQEIKRAYYQNR